MMMMMPTTIERRHSPLKLARRELALREMAKNYLIDFSAYVDPNSAPVKAKDPFFASYYRAPHLALAAKYIEAAEDGSLWENVPGTGVRMLFITMHPGSWKSSLVSRKFPAWFVGKRTKAKRPNQIILTSYNSSLATANNAAVLELMESEIYQNLFPEVQLSKKRRSSEEWALAGSPFMTCKAAGVGAGLSGYHGAVAIADDPIKDRAQANSPAYREQLWEWWYDVLMARVLEDELMQEYGFIIGMWTRWTDDDPIGRIMKQKAEGKNDDRVVILRLPALAETEEETVNAHKKFGMPLEKDPLGRKPGQPMWPQKLSGERLLAIKKTSPITFASLYQQLPRPKGGYVVGQGHFKMLPSIPQKDISWVWATDYALSEKEAAPKRKSDPDYTAVGLIGLWTPDGNRDDLRLVIGYMARQRLQIFDAVQFVEDTVTGPLWPKRYPIYNGQANFEKVVLGIMQRRATLLAFSIKSLKRKDLPGDKMTQAQPWLERAQAGLVYVVEAPWNDMFFEEVENFPNGANDDQVDVVTVGATAHGLAKKSRKATSAKVQGFG